MNDLPIIPINLHQMMGRRTYTRREIVKGGAAALVGATLALPLTSRKAHALTRGVAMGAFTNGNGSFRGDFAELDAYIGLAGGVAPNLVSVYSRWRPDGIHYLHPHTDDLRLFYDRYPGSMMLWSWEPWGVTLQEINSGTHDAYIDEVAQRIKTLGNRVLIRFAHEMNGNWPWPWLKQPPEEYRAAWQRIVTRFRLLGASNAEWIWAPNIMFPDGRLDFRPYYPGDPYTDWTGFSGYNWGTVHTGWRTFREIFRYSIGVITKLSSSRDIIICETGCHSRGPNGESKGYWFQQTATELKQNYSRIKGFVYTHTVDERDGEDADWRVDSPAEALDDWQAFVADPQFKVALPPPREPRGDTTVVDMTPPPAPLITSPANNSFDTDGNFNVSGTAEANAKVELFEGSLRVSKPTTASSDGAWGIPLSGVTDGSHTYTAKATDAANNTSAPSNACTVIVDTLKPRVTGTSPLARATGISPRANVSATFSEVMKPRSINERTFKLYKKGSYTALKATVSYDDTTKKATLNPETNLRRGATYKAVVTTGAKDLAGNALDQNPSVFGNQSKAWTFTIKT